MVNKPKVSVIMPVYNREHMVDSAIQSILNQSLAEFEFIIVDDGSTDNTAQFIRSLKDDRIRFYQLPTNCGIATARNIGLKLAQADFVAIMDSDDRAFEQRLSKQYDFMCNSTHIDILGTNAVKVVGDKQYFMDHSCDEGHIKARLLALNGSSMIHPTIMMRTSFLRKHKLLYPSFITDEDHGLWFNAMCCGARFAMLPEHLLYYVRHGSNITSELAATYNEQQERKSVLRIQIIGQFFPRLSFNEAKLLASIMPPRRSGYKTSELLRILLIIKKAYDDQRSYWGESKQDLFRILGQTEKAIQKILA